MHFEAGDETIDELPLTRCMGPAWLAKLDGTAPRKLITVADLGGLAERFVPGDILILRTGWSALAAEARWRDEWPRVSAELAAWCVEHRVKLLGVEPPSVADVNRRDEITLIHKILLGGGVVIVEGLANLNAISQERFFFAALPLKLLRGDGDALLLGHGFELAHVIGHARPVYLEGIPDVGLRVEGPRRHRRRGRARGREPLESADPTWSFGGL